MSNAAKLAQLRDRIGRIDAELADLLGGDVRVPPAMAQQRAAAMVEAHGLRVAERLRDFAGQFAAHDYRMPAAPEVSPWELAVLLQPQALAQSLAGLIAGNYPAGCETATPASVAERIARLRSERASIEREEFALAEKLGLPQRADIDPRLILGLDTDD